MNSHLEDRIRQLCDRLIAINDDSEEFLSLAAELRSALKEHIERIRRQVLEYPLGKNRRSV